MRQSMATRPCSDRRPLGPYRELRTKHGVTGLLRVQHHTGNCTPPGSDGWLAPASALLGRTSRMGFPGDRSSNEWCVRADGDQRIHANRSGNIIPPVAADVQRTQVSRHESVAIANTDATKRDLPTVVRHMDELRGKVLGRPTIAVPGIAVNRVTSVVRQMQSEVA